MQLSDQCTTSTRANCSALEVDKSGQRKGTDIGRNSHALTCRPYTTTGTQSLLPYNIPKGLNVLGVEGGHVDKEEGLQRGNALIP